MKRSFRLLLLICMGLLAPSAYPFTPPPGEFGWFELPNTHLRDVCPPNGFGGSTYEFHFHCRNVTEAWSGGAFDTRRNRLYIWGGGHNDYSGNEIYALDLNTATMVRLTNPVVPIADRSATPPQKELSPFDGTQPNARHTYDGLVYLPNVDRVWAFSGSLATDGGEADNLTWIFNPNDNSWKKVTPRGDIPNGELGIVSAYDPNTGKIFLHNRHGFYSYEYDSSGGTYTLLNADGYIPPHMNAAIDPKRLKFVIIGRGHEYLYDIGSNSDFSRVTLGTSGDNAILNRQAPGLEYDPVSDSLVAWGGGNVIYSLDLDNRVWTSTAYNRDPGPQHSQGTYGRWAYVPALQAFLVYNAVDSNAFVFVPTGNFVDTTPPSSPTDLSATAPLPTKVELTWTAATDNVGVSGYRVFRDGAEQLTTADSHFAELGLQEGHTYRYTVSALDSAGNESVLSQEQVVTTPSRSVTLPLGDCSSETGIANRHDIVMCEPWETTDWWSNGYLKDPTIATPHLADAARVTRTQIVSEDCVSGNCLKVDMLKGEVGSLSVYWPLLNAEMAPEHLYLRYYIKLAPNWDPYMCDADGKVVNSGGKFPGVADVRTGADPVGQCGNGGARGDGINCWSLRSAYRNCGSGDGQACSSTPDAIMRFGSYPYYYGQAGSTGDGAWWDGDDWGQFTGDGGTCQTTPNNMYCGMGDGGVWVNDRWYRVEMQVTMNTPGLADGVIRGWVDGVLSFEKTNMLFRLPGHDSLHNRLIWLNVYKGGTRGNCNDSAIYLDQMVVATDTPIGGMTSLTNIPPTLRFTVSPTDAQPGDTATLSWESQHASTCTASGGWSGSLPTVGQQQTGALQATSVFMLTCSGTGGSVTKSGTVTLPTPALATVDSSGTSLRAAPPPPPSGTPISPRALAATLLSPDVVSLSWSASEKPEDISDYRVYANGELVATLTSPNYTHSHLKSATQYEFYVVAVSKNGETSAPSPSAIVTTPGALRPTASNASQTVAATVTLPPIGDTYTDPSTYRSLGTRTVLPIAGNRHPLLRFDLSQFPPGTPITRATLMLYDNAKYGTMESTGVFRVSKAWAEGTSNTPGATRTAFDEDAALRWEHYLGDWVDAGGVPQGDQPYAAQRLIDDDRPSWVTWNITSLVQDWVDQRMDNEGVMLRSLGRGDTHVFLSREHPDSMHHPRLVVTTGGLDSKTLTAVADTCLDPSTYKSEGGRNRLDLSGNRRILLRFSLDDLPSGSTVKTAKLRLFDYAKYGNMPKVGVFLAAKPWLEGQSSWTGANRTFYDRSSPAARWTNYLGDWKDATDQAQGDIPLAQTALIDDDMPSWAEWDVTEVVNGWLEGRLPNNGFLLRNLAGGDTHVFRSREYTNMAYRPQLVLEFHRDE